jgi:long-chain acyl-CoA synthetase
VAQTRLLAQRGDNWDERLGEEVMAVVTVRPGETVGAADLSAFCQQRLASDKYPRVFEFRDVLPKSTLGKVLKDELMPGRSRAAVR